MTINAFIFSWNMYGIEAIVPITQYEDYDQLKTIAKLKGENIGKNPIGNIIWSLELRAKYNPDRYYEVYAIECDEGIKEEYLWTCWDENPQFMADLTRERGVKIYSYSSAPINTREILIK